MASGGRVSLELAYVLHRRPYRNTSLLVEAFSAEYGRLGLVARGASTGRHRLAAILQPFQPLLLSWSGRGELLTLTSAEPAGHPTFLRGTTLYSGFYLNELLMRLLQRHVPHPELFAVYRDTLPQLAEGKVGEWLLRLFERELLQELGYGLLLAEDANGRPIEAEGCYCYHLEHGPLPHAGERNCLQVSGRSLLALAGQEAADELVLADAKRLMRAVLRLYLGDKPLASRELFRQFTDRREKK